MAVFPYCDWRGCKCSRNLFCLNKHKSKQTNCKAILKYVKYNVICLYTIFSKLGVTFIFELPICFLQPLQISVLSKLCKCRTIMWRSYHEQQIFMSPIVTVGRSANTYRAPFCTVLRSSSGFFFERWERIEQMIALVVKGFVHTVLKCSEHCSEIQISDNSEKSEKTPEKSSVLESK